MFSVYWAAHTVHSDVSNKMFFPLNRELFRIQPLRALEFSHFFTTHFPSNVLICINTFVIPYIVPVCCLCFCFSADVWKHWLRSNTFCVWCLICLSTPLLFSPLLTDFHLFLFPPCRVITSPLLCPSFVCHPMSLHPSQCVVNFISELQEQMCRFQEEISTRIQEKRALEEREAQQVEPRGIQTQGCGPQIGLACSHPSMSDTDAWTNNGGQTVHVGRLDGWTHLPLLPRHFLSSALLPF